jgi:hypothetical protein
MGFGFVADFGSNPNNPTNPHGSLRFNYGQGPTRVQRDRP